ALHLATGIGQAWAVYTNGLGAFDHGYRRWRNYAAGLRQAGCSYRQANSLLDHDTLLHLHILLRDKRIQSRKKGEGSGCIIACEAGSSGGRRAGGSTLMDPVRPVLPYPVPQTKRGDKTERRILKA